MDRRSKIPLAIFAIVALFLFWGEHRGHLLDALPWLILLACPLMHMFVHGHHNQNGSKRRPDQ
ncbi:DUF2933 domain-containing protein [Marinobacter sp.]|uniref:DUF2933 domain-containing protein n=1 Tax=Marinobacter sp. TaxID=50741 RepID=UPI003A91F89D